MWLFPFAPAVLLLPRSFGRIFLVGPRLWQRQPGTQELFDHRFRLAPRLCLV
ncbi:MAG: hypothetical protein MUC50_18765 [Myxococcota bacterium]|nr:hypothetical protein [Myxococcota bacterium]